MRIGKRMRYFLIMMFNVYGCWKGDSQLYLDSFTGNRKTSNSVYRKILKYGLIEEFDPVYPQSNSLYGLDKKSVEEVKGLVQEKLSKQILVKSAKSNKSSYAVTMITPKGIKWLADYFPDSYYEKYRRGETGQRFRTSDKDKFVRQLMISRAMIFMASSATAAFTNDKPSMYRLYGYLSNEAGGAYSDEIDAEKFPDYLPLDREECLDLVNTDGVFYTNSEAKQFLDMLGEIGEADAGVFETIRGSRCYGVYLSNKTAFLLYQEVPRDDKRIGVKHPFEERMRNAINKAFGGILRYRRSVPYTDARTDLFTAIISDGDSLVYSMSMRASHGRINFTDEEMKSASMRIDRINKINEFSKINGILGADQEKYPRVFVTPTNFTGIMAMSYLCHHTVEEYFRDSADIIKSRPDLFEASSRMYDPFIFGWERGNTGSKITNVIYMPVYEINLLRQLDIGSADEIDLDGLAVITSPQMADCISHALRRKVNYYDAATLDRIYIDNDTGAATSYSASDIQTIRDLITANKICGQGEFWSKEQLKAIKQDPTLKNNLSIVVTQHPFSASNKKTMPREVTQYDRRGIAMDGKDKYEKMRGKRSSREKKYRRPRQANIFVSLDEVDKTAIKRTAKQMDISMSDLLVAAYKHYVQDVLSDSGKHSSYENSPKNVDSDAESIHD